MSIEFTCPECAERNTVGPEFAGRRGTCAFCGSAVIVPQVSGVARAAAPMMTAGTMRTQRSGAPWIIILSVVCVVLLMCGGILAGLLIPAISAGREAGRRAACANNLKQISLALASYEAKNGHFPPAVIQSNDGSPPMSWRIAILPELEEPGLYKAYQTKETWNSPANDRVRKLMPRVFRCPSDSDAAEGDTSYVMISGANTVGGTVGSTGTSTTEIADLSKTILVLEVHGLKIPWTDPRDITIAELKERLRAGGHIGHAAVFNVGMADGSVQHLSNKIDAATLRSLATINGGKPVNIDEGD